MTPDSDRPTPEVRRLALVGQAVEELRRAARDGAGQLVAWELRLPQDASPARRLVHGLWLPVVVARAVLADARVRGRWLRFSAGQVVATVLVAVLALWAGVSGKPSAQLKAEEAAAKEAVALLRARVDGRAAELERRASPADLALVRRERGVFHARLQRLEDRLDSEEQRGTATPDSLPLLLSRTLDDAALERASTRLGLLPGAVEQLGGKRLPEIDLDRRKLNDEVRRKVLEGLAALGQTAEAGQGAPPALTLDETRRLDPRKMEREIRRRAEAAAPAKGAPAAKDAADDAQDQVEDAVAGVVQAVSRTVAPPAPPPTPQQLASARKVRAELKAAALAAVPEAESKLEARLPWGSRLGALGVTGRVLGWLLALWGALYGAQFVVIALCRDYHAELSREACLLTGLAPEDPPRAPRPRFDLRWAVNRVRRQFRGWFVITAGIPVCYLLSLPFPGDTVRNLLIGGWILYWQVVFAASKSQRAWVDEFVAPPPWFIRAWGWVVEKVPLVSWMGAGLYGRMWERASRSLNAPAECVELQPAPFTGLMLFRILGSLPLIKIFTRPLVPVASALLLEAHRERHPPRTLPVVLQAQPVLAPARAG